MDDTRMSSLLYIQCVASTTILTTIFVSIIVPRAPISQGSGCPCNSLIIIAIASTAEPVRNDMRPEIKLCSCSRSSRGLSRNTRAAKIKYVAVIRQTNIIITGEGIQKLNGFAASIRKSITNTAETICNTVFLFIMKKAPPRES